MANRMTIGKFAKKKSKDILFYRKTVLQFVKEAQREHGEMFDYSEVKYVNTYTIVKIKYRQLLFIA